VAKIKGFTVHLFMVVMPTFLTRLENSQRWHWQVCVSWQNKECNRIANRRILLLNMNPNSSHNRV